MQLKTGFMILVLMVVTAICTNIATLAGAKAAYDKQLFMYDCTQEYTSYQCEAMWN